MSYEIEFYDQNKKLATATVNDENQVVNVRPFEGRGLSFMRRMQATIVSGKHTSRTISVQIMGEDGDSVTLLEPMPFK